MNDQPGAPRAARYWKHVGLAATIMLAPGGFILGGALAWRYYRKRKADPVPADPISD